MTQPTPPGMPAYPPQPGVDYASAPPRLSGMALTSMILGIVAIPTTCIFGLGILAAITALVLGIVSLVAINRNPQRLGGKGFAITGIVLGAVTPFLVIPLLMLIAMRLPGLGKARELSNRSICAANLRGIAQSLNVYGIDNGDAFPVMPYAPYGPANAGTSTAAASTTVTPDAFKEMYAPASPVSGSPLAGLWLVVMRGDVISKSFLCKSDNHATTPAMTTSPTGPLFLNFQSPTQISYSVAYPYDSDGKVGPWWRATFDGSLPVLSDMAPLAGTGSPPRNLTSASKTANAGNHQFDGQNVAFADAHVEFQRLPTAGQGGDNIFTAGTTGTTPTGTQPTTPAPITLTGTPGNYDTLMVPARNLDTGSLW